MVLSALSTVAAVARPTFEAVPIVLAAAALWWYLRSLRRLRAVGGRWSSRRTASFGVAVVSALAATESVVVGVGPRNFIGSVVSVLLLETVAPVFFGLSAPLSLAVAGGGARTSRRVAAALRSRAAAVAWHPVIAWAPFAILPFAYYFSGLFPLSIDHGAIREAVWLGLLASGCLYFWPVTDLDTLPSPIKPGPRVLYTLLTLPYFTLLGMMLESVHSPLAPGVDLAEVHAGGVVLLTAGDIIGLVAMLCVLFRWLSAEERGARRRDHEVAAEAAAEVQLAHWRAVREAAARAARQGTEAR
jgi:cytochrome c oxidase assembly factor CtaG